MPTALIADDEPLMLEALLEHLSNLWPDLEVVARAENGPQALNGIETHRPDFAFLDIRMPGLSGLDVAKSVTAPTRIVFVTAYDSHAVQAFEANAVDYVLKPVEPARLARVVSKLRQSLPAAPPPQASGPKLEWLQVSKGNQIKLTRFEDVLYFKSDEKYTEVVTAGWRGLVRLSLKQILDAAPAGVFLQTHRSTLVNRSWIKTVHVVDDRMEIEVQGVADRLPVSQSNHSLFRGM